MELRELAMLRSQGQFDKIVYWADGIDIAQMNNLDELLFAAEAYLKMGQVSTCAGYYWKALRDFEDETAASQLLNTFKVQNEWEKLTELADYLDEQVILDDYMFLARFEALRASGADVQEQMDSLKEYLDEFSNDELYYILYLEMLAENEEWSLLERYLKQFKRSFANSEYDRNFIAGIEAALAEKSAVRNEKSIRSLIYVPIYVKNENAKEENTGSGVGVSLGSSPSEMKKEAKSTPTATVKEEKTKIKTVSLSDLLRGDMFAKARSKKAKNEEPPTMDERFEDIVGMKEIRDKVGGVYRVLKMQMEREGLDIKSEMLTTSHFVIVGRRGSGKTLLARTIGKMLVDYGIRGEEIAVEIEARDFEENYDQLNGQKDITLVIENIERCRDQQGSFGEFAWKLRKFLMDHKEDMSVILTGTADAAADLMAEEKDIAGLVYPPNDMFEIKPYSADELMEMMVILAKKKGWRLTDDAKELLKKQLTKERNMSTFADGKTLEEKLSIAMTKAAERYAQLEDVEDEDAVMLEASDFEQKSMEDSVEELLKKLDDMTGLAAVKAEVRKVIGSIMVAQSGEAVGVSNGLGGRSLHMVFKGGPGTGKTTVARIIGEIYTALGILPGNKEGLVEVSAQDLISAYVGDTALKTQKVIDRAMGGILFIDEAYSLTQNQFGTEAITVMLKTMEDCRDSIVFILAGYEEDMNKLLDTNVGLRSRLQTQVVFEDYTPEEMLSIFRDIVASKNRFLEKDTKDLILELLRQGAMSPDFGNARGVRNLVDLVENAKSERLTQMLLQGKTPEPNDYDMIKREDIQAVMADSSAGTKSVEELLAELNEMEGMEQLKEVINQIATKVRSHAKKKELGIEGELDVGTLHMVFSGGPGTGKTTMARKIGEIYKALGILPRGDKIMECDGKDLIGQYVGQTAPIVAEKVRHSMGGILFIDEAYQLSRGDGNSFGAEAIDALVKVMEDKRDSFMVILAGYTKEMEEFLDKNPGLRSRIREVVEFKDYSVQELVNIFIKMATGKGFAIEEAAIPSLERLLKQEMGKKDFGNARGARNLLTKVLGQVDVRILATENITAEECKVIIKADIEAQMEDSVPEIEGQSVEQLLAQLNEMIGLASVKNAVNSIVKEAQYNVWAKAQGIAGADEFGTLHMLFKGNAGTGKTTVARMLGDIYKQLGVLRSGHLVECNRDKLVGGYVGQTAIKTQEIIDSAMGGILFVDEAYELNKGGNDFGGEALNTIMTAMENHRDDLMVIFAGYSKEIDELIATNQGLESRFSKQNEIIFEDYSKDELLQIFLFQAKKKGLIVSEELHGKVADVIQEAKEAADNFGNARGVRNIVEAVDKARKGRIQAMVAAGADVSPQVALTLTEDDLKGIVEY